MILLNLNPSLIILIGLAVLLLLVVVGNIPMRKFRQACRVTK